MTTGIWRTENPSSSAVSALAKWGIWGGSSSGTLRIGSIPSPTSFLSMCASKTIPVSSLKHSRIIHRRGMRARLWRSRFATDPPPTSERASMNNNSMCAVELERTAVGAGEEHLFDIGVRPSVSVDLIFELGRRPRPQSLHSTSTVPVNDLAVFRNF